MSAHIYLFMTFGLITMTVAWVKVFRIIPEFRILRLTFYRKAASKSFIMQNIIASDLFQFI